MADTRVARRYAQALFDVAERGGETARVEEDLNLVADLMEQDAKFKDFMISPNVPRDRRLRIMETVFGPKLSKITMSALRLLVTKRREDLTPDVRNRFVEIRREQGKVLFAQVSSATELKDADRKKIVDKLEKTSGKKVEATFRVDPGLIAGVRVAYGNYVLDGSVKGGLRRMKDQLRYELLKQA
ncbi:MAG: ATP synthase F1 subunit delta [Armatimonadetes bacterium]|nr:ATP synthase F1 subunit delta [Armatimonadota bacterium]